MKWVALIMLFLSCSFLAACAVQPNDDYNLTADEMKTAGSASMPEHQNVAQLYDHSEFIKPKGRV